jgi:hypothetical protein
MKSAGSGKHQDMASRNNFAKSYNDGVSAMLMDMAKIKAKLPKKKRSSAWWR